jgi:hypothetical protein
MKSDADTHVRQWFIILEPQQILLPGNKFHVSILNHSGKLNTDKFQVSILKHSSKLFTSK